MAKLKNIIKQLSQKDYETIFEQLIQSNAEKSAYLLQSIREKQLSDHKVMEELDVNTNAYYTLRSRLNQKIEEYLLHQLESPRTDLLKKVANINEILFTKKQAIAIATLKKLQKELLDYDLQNELTVVYKALKKLHQHSPQLYTYSQLYNRHVAFMLAVDKTEELMADYFKKYGEFFLKGHEASSIELDVITQELSNINALYSSHRLFVYRGCVTVFHRLFVMDEDYVDPEEEPTEDILKRMAEILEQYNLDSTYYHLTVVVDFLYYEYYNSFKVYRKAESYFEEVNESLPLLLSNYTQVTFGAQFLQSKLQRSQRVESTQQLHEEAESLFEGFEANPEDVPTQLIYTIYRALSLYHHDKHQECARLLNQYLNAASIKQYPQVHLEVKLLLVMEYAILNDFDLFQQLVNSIQRQIRLLGKENCGRAVLFSKILKTAISEAKKDKGSKIKALAEKMSAEKEPVGFSPISLVPLDSAFVNRLVGA